MNLTRIGCLLRVTAAMAVATVAFSGPAAADTVSAGPCTFDLDNPHVSSKEVYKSRTPIVRVHARYRCSSSVLYANAQVTLYRCDNAGQNTATCVSVGSGTGQDSTYDVNYSGTYKILAVAESDPYPNTGWYTAKAVYEVCLLNGGAIPAYGSTPYAHYDAQISKFDAIWTPLQDIYPPPL